MKTEDYKLKFADLKIMQDRKYNITEKIDNIILSIFIMKLALV